MKSVIAQTISDAVGSTTTAHPAAALVISDDPRIVSGYPVRQGPRRFGDPDSVLVWNPEALDGPRSNCAWDLLGGITEAADADRIANFLLSTVLDNRLASFFVPEASLLVANMILAAAQGGRTFGEVLDWVSAETTAPARELLVTHSEADAHADMLAFDAQDDITRGSVWETAQMALQPLNFGPVLDAVCRAGDGRVSMAAPFAALHSDAAQSPAPATVYVLRSQFSPFRGLAEALVDELLRVASAHSTRTNVLEFNTYGSDRSC